jgi:hypothetical protein
VVCKVCGDPLPEPDPAGGRPRSYCSERCRRARELKLRRLDSRLASLEARLDLARLELARRRIEKDIKSQVKYAEQQVEALEDVIGQVRDEQLVPTRLGLYAQSVVY